MADRPSPATALPDGRFRVALSGLILATVLSSLDLNIVATALPRIAGELGDVSQIPWIVTAFMLSATITTPIYGKLSTCTGAVACSLAALRSSWRHPRCAVLPAI